MFDARPGGAGVGGGGIEAVPVPPLPPIEPVDALRCTSTMIVFVSLCFTSGFTIVPRSENSMIVVFLRRG